MPELSNQEFRRFLRICDQYSITRPLKLAELQYHHSKGFNLSESYEKADLKESTGRSYLMAVKEEMTEEEADLVAQVAPVIGSTESYQTGNVR